MSTVADLSATPPPEKLSRPRIGFLGLGWIGRNRMEAMAESGFIEVAGISDTAAKIVSNVSRTVPTAEIAESLDTLLELDLDGLVIATPSALHAEQTTRALERGLAVFCQKPLGRNARETRNAIDLAHRKNRLLGVDLSYRYINCLQQLNELCRSELGEIFAADLTFHNAYGPDKPWFYDKQLSGGGCVIDLGIHLVDLALWNLGFPKVMDVTSHLFSQGKPIGGDSATVEDYAVATLTLENGATIRLTCSWNLHAGRDAIISGSFYGTRGGGAFKNVDGSFYDFSASRFHKTSQHALTCLTEKWGGRAAVHWAKRLAENGEFDPEINHLKEVARIIDAIYAAA
jgi:predicted dehydrogenase